MMSTKMLLAEAILNKIVCSRRKKYTARCCYIKSFDSRPLCSYLNVFRGSKTLTRVLGQQFTKVFCNVTSVQHARLQRSLRIVKAQEISFSGHFLYFLVPFLFKSLSILTFGGKSGRFWITCTVDVRNCK